MKLSKISISNFRMLQSVELSFEDDVTLIVGRNNSGKTSITEFFNRFIGSANLKFNLEDFSTLKHHLFKKGFDSYKNQGLEKDIIELLPTIEAYITFTYNKSEDLGPLSAIVIDLEEDCFSAIIKIVYSADESTIQHLFQPSIDLGTNLTNEKFWRLIKAGIQQSYSAKLFAQDPTNESNRIPIKVTDVQRVLLGSFISAQRSLDGNKGADRNVLGRMLESLFSKGISPAAPPDQKKVLENLENAVSKIQYDLDNDFSAEVAKLLPTIRSFGYPGSNRTEFKTETTLDAARLLSDNTRVLYDTKQGTGLPESYDGLGSRNLIYMLIQMLVFFQDFKSLEIEPATHMIFIEEPEAHLHPQMQEVFIRQLKIITQAFEKQYNEGKKWPVQFVVTTHSSHIANEAPFESIRYFRPAGGLNSSTDIRDLRNATDESLGKAIKEHRKFLQKFFTLTKCDLFFADKAIFIEGPTERLMLPALTRKVEKKIKEKKGARNLSEQPEFELQSQYISTIEVNGAYAHKFFPILSFLGIKTLIITDIDSIDGSNKKALPKSTYRTSNETLKEWFGEKEITIQELWDKVPTEKIKSNIRIAYQIHESNSFSCGRSFEEAFILANLRKFNIREEDNSKIENAVEVKAKQLNKLEFAIKYGIDDDNWEIPSYVEEGLVWLRNDHVLPTTVHLTNPQIV